MQVQLSKLSLSAKIAIVKLQYSCINEPRRGVQSSQRSIYRQRH